MQNRLYSRIDSKTPYEVWNNVKPDLSYFYPFGSKAYVFIPDQCRSKLDGKCEMKTMIGYDDHIKGYRLLDVKTRKITIAYVCIPDQCRSKLDGKCEMKTMIGYDDHIGWSNQNARC